MALRPTQEWLGSSAHRDAGVLLFGCTESRLCTWPCLPCRTIDQHLSELQLCQGQQLTPRSGDDSQLLPSMQRCRAACCGSMPLVLDGQHLAEHTGMLSNPDRIALDHAAINPVQHGLAAADGMQLRGSHSSMDSICPST